MENQSIRYLYLSMFNSSKRLMIYSFMGGGPHTQILSYSYVDKICLNTLLNLCEV